MTLLNRMGHCSSYDDVEIINTAREREMEARSQQTGVVIPSNITAGPFVQFAADNNDFNEETLDGKQTTHATTLVVYQRQPFGPKLPPKIQADHTSRRSLEQPVQGQLMHECSVHGKRPALTSFSLGRKNVAGEWLRGCVHRVWPLRIELYYGTIAGKIVQQ